MTATSGESQKQLVRETFDGLASTWAEVYQGDTSVAHKFTIRRQRVYELVDGRGGKMLDVGCGPGMTVDHFVRRGFELYGVDLSPNAVAECTRTFSHLATAHFSVGSIDHLDFPSGFFDVVTCMGVLQYLDDGNNAVQEMARVCKPGGLVIITLPYKGSTIRRWNRMMGRSVRHAVNMATARGRFLGDLERKAYGEGECRHLLASHGLIAREFVYCNFEILPFPLERAMPRLSLAISRRLEPLCRGPLKRLAAGFVVQADKR